MLVVLNTDDEKHKLQPLQHDPLAALMGFGQENVVVSVAHEAA